MKEKILVSSLKGRGEKNKSFPNTTYVWNVPITSFYPTNFPVSGVRRLEYNPSMALIDEIFNPKGMIGALQKEGKIIGYFAENEGILSIMDLADDTLYLGIKDKPLNEDDEKKFFIQLVCQVSLAKMIDESEFARATLKNLTKDLKGILERNKSEYFYILSDGIFQTAKENFCKKNKVVLDIDDETKKHLNSLLNNAIILDFTDLVKQKREAYELPSMISNLNVKTPKFEEKRKSTFSMEEFLQTDWSVMSDEEAEKLPVFMQEQRKRMRKFFEENKSTLRPEVALKIVQMHDKKLRNISFSGDSGSGKSFSARMIAGALNLPMHIVVGQAGADVSSYLGCYQLVSENGASKTVWKDGAVTEAVRYGGLLFFDEINVCEPEVIASLNTLLDDISNCLCLSSGETVYAHDNFYYIEAMNIGSGFDGTNKMNNSHRRRMQRKIRFQLPTEAEEIQILKNKTGYENEYILKTLIQVENFIRANLEDRTTQYVTISELIEWIREAEYTGEWINSACGTILAPLMEQDEFYADYSTETITSMGDTIVLGALDFIIEKLGSFGFC